MANYIDGFVHPIPRDQLDTYQRLATAIADIWLEHGAIAYQEFEGDDMALEGTRSFIDQVGATDAEVIVFGWVEFESRAARDLINAKVTDDPRMPALMEASSSGFDPGRMAYAGFKPLV